MTETFLGVCTAMGCLWMGIIIGWIWRTAYRDEKREYGVRGEDPPFPIDQVAPPQS